MTSTHMLSQLTISKENPFTTYIQTLSTSFEHQQAVIDGMSQLNQALAPQGGFVAVALLRNLDGQRVVNYVQWEHEQELFTALHSPAVQSTLASLEAFISENRRGGLSGLLRQPRSDRGMRRKISSEMHMLIERLATQKPKCTVAAIYREVTTVASEQGWSMPSYSSVYALVQSLEQRMVRN